MFQISEAKGFRHQPMVSSFRRIPKAKETEHVSSMCPVGGRSKSFYAIKERENHDRDDRAFVGFTDTEKALPKFFPELRTNVPQHIGVCTLHIRSFFFLSASTSYSLRSGLGFRERENFPSSMHTPNPSPNFVLEKPIRQSKKVTGRTGVPTRWVVGTIELQIENKRIIMDNKTQPTGKAT